MTEEQVPQLRNLPVYSGGEEIGHVGDVYYNDSTQTVECVGIKGDVFGFKRQWVPAQGAVLQDDGIHLSYTREQFEGAPRWDDESDIDDDRYQQVRDHFTRHEEELHVGKERQQAGSVRLRKSVETQPVSADVELERETAQVVRQPIDEPIGRDPDGAFGEEVVEVPLEAEHAVVSKETVAKERVGVETGVERRTETVEDEVRKERVDVEPDGNVDVDR
jgi:uncharacterized protein (TIGR02271 family)